MRDEMEKGAGPKWCRAFYTMLRVLVVSHQEREAVVFEGRDQDIYRGPVGNGTEPSGWRKSYIYLRLLFSGGHPAKLCMESLL